MAIPYTQKHFCDVAEILHVQRSRAQSARKDWQPTNDRVSAHAGMATVDAIADEFADLFTRVNPRFDRALFLAGVRGDKPVNARPSKKAPNTGLDPLDLARARFAL